MDRFCDLGPPRQVLYLPFKFHRGFMERELSIFIDESGDLGNYQNHSPFYIISLVFHEQNKSISNEVKKLDNYLAGCGLPNHTIHTAPLIRQEQIYKNMNVSIRSKLFRQLFNFIRSVDVSYKTIVVDKKMYSQQVDMTRMITMELASFIKSNFSYFTQFDKIIIYYDNGQIQLTKILIAIFGALLENSEFRVITPNNYKLFQAADLICTLALIKNKLISGKKLTNSEEIFFGSAGKLRKNYLKFFEKIEFNHKTKIQL